MRPSIVRIITIFTFIGFAMSMQPYHRAVSVERALIFARQGSSSQSPAAGPTGTSSTTTTSSTKSSSSSSSATKTSTSRSTSSQEPTSTSDTSTSVSETSTTRRTSSSSSSTSSSTQSTSASSSSSVASSDRTESSVAFATSSASALRPTTSGSTSFTVTAVGSRPTGSTTNDEPSASSSKNGFFANKGAVAGTFLVVGLFGTALLLCVFLWVLRKCRRRRSNRAYDEDEYREFNRNGATPEPTLPTARDSAFVGPISTSPAPNMIERLHGKEPIQNMYYDGAQGQYQRESGDFDPYSVHNAANPYPGGPANYAQYSQYAAQQGPQDHGAYAYEPQVGADYAGPVHQQAAAGPSHAHQQSADSFYEMASLQSHPQAR